MADLSPDELAQRDARIAELERAVAVRDERIAELERGLQVRDARIAALEQQLSDLSARLTEIERAGKRQATPFARRKQVAQPKKPGRKKGKGRFAHRARPTPAQVQTTKDAPLADCPACHGPLTERKDHEQFVVDIPPIEPEITRYVTHSGYCAQCQRRMRSQHPEQISQATGAAGVVLGPRVKAVVADGHTRLGLSYGKLEDWLGEVFGIRFTRGGQSQANGRLARHTRAAYDVLIEVLRRSSAVHVDETGWRINTLAAWLWVFTNQRVTVYTIEHSRGHEVVIEILGRQFRGTLIADCFTAYDHAALRDWLQQKCLSHLLKDARELQAIKTRGAVRFARGVTRLLQDALALRDARETLTPRAFARRAAALERRLDQLIDARRQFSDVDNRRFAKRLRRQRPHLLRFLYLTNVEATNNRAERGLRPAVITRKTGGCHRTSYGAQAHAILASILVTARQHAVAILDLLIRLQRAPDHAVPGLAVALFDSS